MKIKKAQEDVTKIFDGYCKHFEIEKNKDFLVKKVFEETGEVAQAQMILERQSKKEKFKGKKEALDNLGLEIADAVGQLFVLASEYDIDIEEALEKKWFQYKDFYGIK